MSCFSFLDKLRSLALASVKEEKKKDTRNIIVIIVMKAINSNVELVDIILNFILLHQIVFDH